MRLRNDKNAINILLDNQKWYLHEPNRIDNNIFNNNQKIELEIGMGKGNFIINKALQNPEINYVGLEKNLVICSKAIKKIIKSESDLNNLKIINIDAKNLNTIFTYNSIDKIYLNFSDPWPKKRHIKNRLTNPSFLKIYKQILRNNGWIEFKTDNDDLFKYTLEVLKENNDWCEIIYYTTDLYSNLDNEYNLNNIATEYEMKFHNLNKNINKIIFKFI